MIQITTLSTKTFMIGKYWKANKRDFRVKREGLGGITWSPLLDDCEHPIWSMERYDSVSWWIYQSHFCTYPFRHPHTLFFLHIHVLSISAFSWLRCQSMYIIIFSNHQNHGIILHLLNSNRRFATPPAKYYPFSNHNKIPLLSQCWFPSVYTTTLFQFHVPAFIILLFCSFTCVLRPFLSSIYACNPTRLYTLMFSYK